MRNFVADLHNHTIASDGEYTPTELVQAGASLGLKAIGVTDHDTLNGLDEAMAAGEVAGIQVVPGVEVSLRFRRSYFVGTLHYLLYIPYHLLQDADFRQLATDIFGMGRGLGLVRSRVDAINEIYGPNGRSPLLRRELTIREIQQLADNATRRHFALALSQNHGLDRQQINLLIGNDSLAYVPSGIDPHDLTPLLRAYPQLVRVFAHPAAGSFPGQSLYNEVLPPLNIINTLLPEFLDDEVLGLDGLEVHYPGHIAEHEALLTNWANEYGLMMTGGSDCHDRVERPLGITGVSQAELTILMQRLTSEVLA